MLCVAGHTSSHVLADANVGVNSSGGLASIVPVPPYRASEMRYLETDQFQLGGEAACTFAGCYWALYLLFSSSPLESTVKRYLRQACDDWQALRPTQAMRSRLEHAGDVYKEVPQLRSAMSIQADYQGFMITQEVQVTLRELIHKISSDNPDYHQAFGFAGVRPFFQKIAKDVVDQKRGRALSFVFTRAGATLGGAFRLMPDGVTMRIDIIDSHQHNFDPEARFKAALQRHQLMAGPPPIPLEHGDPGCATWVTCYSIDDAVGWLERYYEPSNDAHALYNYLVSGSHGRLDRQKFPNSLFSLVVFEPNQAQMAGPSRNAY